MEEQFLMIGTLGHYRSQHTVLISGGIGNLAGGSRKWQVISTTSSPLLSLSKFFFL
jgi:hypothetical protein